MGNEIDVESKAIYRWKLGQENNCDWWIWDFIGTWGPSLYKLRSIHGLVSCDWFDDEKDLF